jgi:hypothetical protein
MRAIDELKDHPALPNGDRIRILESVGPAFRAPPYDIGAEFAGDW